MLYENDRIDWKWHKMCFIMVFNNKFFSDFSAQIWNKDFKMGMEFGRGRAQFHKRKMDIISTYVSQSSYNQV